MQPTLPTPHAGRVLGTIYKWQLAPFVLIAVFVTTLVVLWRPWRFIRLWWPRYFSSKPGAKRPENFLRSFAVSWWAIVMIVTTSIWIATVYNEEHRSLSACVLPFFGALCIVLLTFALEGLETAYIELRDKDEQQFANKPAADLFKRINKMMDGSQMKGGAFFEAREWAIITLLVAATIMIDKSEYYIPLVSVHVTQQDQPALWTVVRLVLTVALTTFALVWVAQSPGKYVARMNSVAFLGNRSSKVSLWLLQVAWRILSFVGLQCPSVVTNQLASKMMPESRSKRNLLPSEFSCFADDLKKYGYGFLIAETTLNVQPDGSIHIVHRTLFYLGMPRTGVKRSFAFEEGFQDRTMNSLKNNDQTGLKCWAFETSQIGERVTEDDLKTWGSLFYAKDPANWEALDHTPVSTKRFTLGHVLTGPPSAVMSQSSDADKNSVERPLYNLDVELHFRQRLPADTSHLNADLSNGASHEISPKAALVLWEVEVFTNPKTVELPEVLDKPTRYPYYKSHSHPALRENIVINLPEIQEDGVIFVNLDDPVNYEVTYDGLIHARETDRFRSQRRKPLYGSPEKPQDSRLWKKAEFYIDSPLPAASYKVFLHIDKEAACKAREPIAAGKRATEVS